MSRFSEFSSRVLSAEGFRLGVLAGARKVIENRHTLNRINVFPVPDRDTGNNLAATMNAIIAGLGSPQPTFDAMVNTLASSALSGAQGNSGVILAEFFQGLREGIAGCVHLSVERFARAMRSGATRARAALAQPRDGTILTVIDDVADHINALVDRIPDFRSLFDEGLKAAKRSLASTPRRLAALRAAGVVDAGALGFVHFWEGIRDQLFRGNSVAAPSTAADVPLSEPLPPDPKGEEDLDFRYCTEAVLSNAVIEKAALLRRLAEFGDSIVVAGSEGCLHVHLHTNVPALVLEALTEHADVTASKVDDMWEQMAGIDTPSRDGGIALVTDSVCDLPIAFFTDRRIHVIPLQVSFDDEVLLDRIDITPNQFYTRLRTEAAHPTTSQPRPIDYMRVYKRLSERHEEILSIHVSAQLSGTLNAARSAAEKTTAQTGTRITVVDSRSASAAEGLVVWAAAQAIEQGLGSEASARVAAAAAENTSILVYVPTVKYFVRGGRLSPIQGRIARALHLLPILTVREGRVVPAGKAIGRRAAKKRVLRRTLQHAAGLRRPAFAVSHSAAPTLAREFEEALARRFPHAPMLCASVAPALGSHAGPGGATIAVFDAAILDDALGAAKNGSR